MWDIVLQIPEPFGSVQSGIQISEQFGVPVTRIRIAEPFGSIALALCRKPTTIAHSCADLKHESLIADDDSGRWRATVVVHFIHRCE